MRTALPLLCAVAVLVANCANAKPYSLWTALGASKYLRNEVPAKSIPVSLDAAGNEWEAFQVIVRADKPIRAMSVSAGDLKSKAGVIPKSNVELRLAHYIELTQGVGGGFPNGFYPDALLPMPAQFSVKQGDSQMVWVNIRVPSNTKPGIYLGKLTVNIDGQAETVNIKLRVRSFALSVENHFGSAFALWPDQVSKYYGIDPDSQEMKALVDRYYWFMINYRLAPDDLPVPVTSPEADKYIGDPRVASFRIPYNPDDPADFLKTINHIRDKGWMPKGYIYTIDEPPAADFQKCADYGRHIDTLAKDAKWLLTAAPTEVMNGTVDLWCPILREFHPEACAQRQAAGDTVWWYTCCAPQHPFPTYLINDTATAPRVLSWFQYANRVQGVLYWSTSIWLKYDGTKYIPRDVWHDPLAFPGSNGDGYLLYPGKTAADDPIPTLRLEMLRQGNEDFEALYILEQKYAKLAESLGLAKADYDAHTRAEDYVGKIGSGLTIWNRDPELMESLRRGVFNEIESLNAGPKVIVSTGKHEGSLGDGIEVPVSIWAEPGAAVSAVLDIDGVSKSVPVRMVRAENGKSLKAKLSFVTGRKLTRLVVMVSKGGKTKTIARTFSPISYKPMVKLKNPNYVWQWRSEADTARWQRNDADMVLEKGTPIGDCAKVTYHAGAEFPNVRITAPSCFTDTDWSKKDYVSVPFYNPNPFTVSMNGKMFDADGTACDGLSIVLGPGEAKLQTWSLANLPAQIDLKRFSMIEFWMSSPSKPVTVCIGSIATTVERPQ